MLFTYKRQIPACAGMTEPENQIKATLTGGSRRSAQKSVS
jgi:hypothetical protein